MCHCINAQGCEAIPELESSQEEADTRILLHSAHAAMSGFEAVVIVSDDTDVFLLSIAFQNEITASLYWKGGTQARVKYIEIQKITRIFGESVCKAIIGVHSFTGCDSVSTFAGRGKLNALKLMIGDAELQETFGDLGREWIVPSHLIDKLETFTCQLYLSKTSATKVDDLHYGLFAAKKGNVEPHHLPLCSNALKKHIFRANYQTAIWRRCLIPKPEVLLPNGHGWKLEILKGQCALTIEWMDIGTAPESVMALLSCNCAKSCTAPKCSCVVNGLKCS